jgi:hypothetical protein
MSRTKKGAKGPGYEYWGRRGYPSVRMATPGRDAKMATHRLERRDDAKAEREELQEALRHE